MYLKVAIRYKILNHFQLPEEGQKWGFLIWLLFSYCGLVCIASICIGKVSSSFVLFFKVQKLEDLIMVYSILAQFSWITEQ